MQQLLWKNIQFMLWHVRVLMKKNGPNLIPNALNVLLLVIAQYLKHYKVMCMGTTRQFKSQLPTSHRKNRQYLDQ